MFLLLFICCMKCRYIVLLNISITAKTFTGIDHIWITQWVSFIPIFFFLVLLIFLAFSYVVLWSVFTSCVPRFELRCNFLIKTMLDSSLLCLRRVVSNTYPVLFLLCFSSSCCQFLWFVYFWLSVRCSLTFLYCLQCWQLLSVQNN